MKHVLAFVCAFLAAITSLHAGDTIRVCSYNLLKFSQSNEDGRIPQFARILDSIRPDIMVNQEVMDAASGPLFVSEVLKWAPFAAVPFNDGPDSDNLLFYNETKFDLVSTRVIQTDLRNILEVTLALRPHDATLADTIVMYSVHLKASDGSTESAQRAREIATLIGAMSPRGRIMICGDFNIYSTSEPAYTALIGSTATRRFVDPLGSHWRRNDASFSKIFTQSTRNVTIGACGGGVSGGLDDRFDLILASEELSPRVITSSYTAFGNDGLSRLNESIDEPVNQIVSAEMAAALKCASDHLPLFVDVILGDIPASVEANARATIHAKWLAPYLVVSGMQYSETYRVYSTTGAVVATITATASEQRIMLSSLPSGAYTFNGLGTSVRFVVVR